MIVNHSKEDIDKGQAVYSKATLFFYDLAVISIANYFIWRCPRRYQLDLYNRHVTSNHLDVGVGTGYFLDHCRFPVKSPRVALMDMNESCLSAAARRIRRYNPEIYKSNIMEPDAIDVERFDSISANYLLHCLPGHIKSKKRVFDNLKSLLNPNGTIFGSTILQCGVEISVAARWLMRFYNSKGVFTNAADDLAGLRSILEAGFTESRVDTVGSVALFSARI